MNKLELPENTLEYEIYSNVFQSNPQPDQPDQPDQVKQSKKPEHKPDSIVSSVINKFMERAKMGKEKYGTDLDRTDLSLYDWIVHAQDEHMDAILYLEKIKQLIVKN